MGFHTHLIRRRSPYPLPAERCKAQPRKGVGDSHGNRTVTQILASSSCSPKGELLSFFSFCVFGVWSGVFCRFLSFLFSKGRFLEKFSGANFCFWVLVLVLCFLVGFCLCFCFFFGGSLPKVFGKILLLSGLFFFGFVLSSGFFVDVVFSRFFFLRDRDQVVTGHPLTRTCFACSFSFCCPAAFLFRPFWPCVLLLGGFSGCHSGPRAFWDSPWTF